MDILFFFWIGGEMYGIIIQKYRKKSADMHRKPEKNVEREMGEKV